MSFSTLKHCLTTSSFHHTHLASLMLTPIQLVTSLSLLFNTDLLFTEGLSSAWLKIDQYLSTKTAICCCLQLIIAATFFSDFRRVNKSLRMQSFIIEKSMSHVVFFTGWCVVALMTRFLETDKIPGNILNIVAPTLTFTFFSCAVAIAHLNWTIRNAVWDGLWSLFFVNDLHPLPELLNEIGGINVQNSRGETPLLIAINADADISTVEYLLCNGANPFIKSQDGDAFQVAKSSHQKAIVATIQNYINCKNEQQMLDAMIDKNGQTLDVTLKF